MTFNSTISAEDRRELFHEEYGNHFDPGWSLAYLINGCGRYLAQIVGEERANKGMTEIVRTLALPYVQTFTEDEAKTRKWAEVIEGQGTDAFTFLPLGAKFHDLTAYAIYGITLDYEPGEADRTEKERERFLKDRVSAAKKFWDESPFDKWGLEGTENVDLEMLVLLATNRWALDHGDPVEPRALAWFGGLSEGSIRNLMSASKLENKGGRIPANSALAWLAERPDFYNSVWQNQVMTVPHSSKEEIARADFVPVGRDGSIFHPGLIRNGGFTIGPKGEEKKIESFDLALLELQRSVAVHWRRPNDAGNWGTVKGIRWERLDRDFLNSLADQPKFRLADNQGNNRKN